MEINYELTQRDFTESLAVHRNRRPVVKWVRWVVMWVMLLTSAFLLFGAIRTGNTRTLMPFFGLVAFWLLLMSGLLSRWSARRQFVKQPGAHGPRTLLLNEAGTHWRWNGGSSDVEWRNYIRALEGQNQFLLYTSPACFNIIPKRAMGNESLAEVRSLLKQNVPSEQ